MKARMVYVAVLALAVVGTGVSVAQLSSSAGGSACRTVHAAGRAAVQTLPTSQQSPKRTRARW